MLRMMACCDSDEIDAINPPRLPVPSNISTIWDKAIVPLAVIESTF
jgi:hypothetical protein